MSAFRLRDCFRPLDYFLLGTLAGGLPIAFELGIEVSADAGILASLCLLAALLIVAWRAGREAERLAYGAPDRSLPPRGRRYWGYIGASVLLAVFIKGPLFETIAAGEVMRLVNFIAWMGALFLIAVALLCLGRSIFRLAARYRQRALPSPRPTVLAPSTSAAARADRSWLEER